MVLQSTATGEIHGLLESLPNAVPFDDFKNMKAADAEKMRKQKKEDERMVKAKYINHQDKQLGRLEKVYCRYAGEPIQKWKLIHDYEYTLPMGLIDEVNQSKIPVREGLQSVDGKDINRDGSPLQKDRYDRIHELVPCSFK
jgi:hypothetical protein